MRLIRQRQSTPFIAWKNGGGVTQELLAWPTAQRWGVRLSLATIDKDGPFSSLAGISRWFTVIEGSGVDLNLDGQTKTVRLGDAPLPFDGSQNCEATLLEGSVTAFNVMMSDQWAGCVQRIQSPGSVSFSREGYIGLFGLEPCKVEFEQVELQLEKDSLLWQPINSPCSLAVHAGVLIAVHAWPSVEA